MKNIFIHDGLWLFITTHRQSGLPVNYNIRLPIFPRLAIRMGISEPVLIEH